MEELQCPSQQSHASGLPPAAFWQAAAEAAAGATGGLQLIQRLWDAKMENQDEWDEQEEWFQMCCAAYKRKWKWPHQRFLASAEWPGLPPAYWKAAVEAAAGAQSETDQEEDPVEFRNRYLRGIRRVEPRQIPRRGKCPLYDRHLPVSLAMLNSRW